jgi:hypothetical protein
VGVTVKHRQTLGQADESGFHELDASAMLLST